MASSTDVDVKGLTDQEVLVTLKSYDEIVKHFAKLGVNVEDDEADGIVSLDVLDNDDKHKLEGVPFTILTWRINENGKHGAFASMVIQDDNGNVLVVNDGGAGICAQLQQLTEHRIANGHPTPNAGRRVRKGLRVSEYTYIDAADGGKEKPAKTFYLNY